VSIVSVWIIVDAEMMKSVRNDAFSADG